MIHNTFFHTNSVITDMCSFRWQTAFTVFLLSIFSVTSEAELVVHVHKKLETAHSSSAVTIPLAIVPFVPTEGSSHDGISGVVTADLGWVGRFRLLPVASLPEHPAIPGDVHIPAWQAIEQRYVVSGRILTSGPGEYEAEWFLFDVVENQLVLSEHTPFTTDTIRGAAHHISDLVYKQLSHENGLFSTRFAYVSLTERGKKQEYSLQIADIDGENIRSIDTSPYPIMSPAWSPDGQQLAYVSFEQKASSVVVQNITTHERQKVSHATGINGAPAWSPDGSQLALTLSKEGNADVYILDIHSRSLKRITYNTSSDTEAAWSPDGQRIVFTSDRSGKPQLYTVSRHGGEADRLTFEGERNAHGVFSPDGQHLAMVQSDRDHDRVVVIDLPSQAMHSVSEGRVDESPSFGPTSQMVLYLHTGDQEDQAIIADIHGIIRHRIPMREERMRGLSWSR